MNQTVNEKTSKLKNILHYLYTILCYTVYIVFIFFMVCIFIITASTIYHYITSYITSFTYKPSSSDLLLSKPSSFYYLSKIIAHTPIVVISAICIFKSIKAVINETFSLYRITRNLLIILSFGLLVATFFHSCPCQMSLTFGMAVSTFLLIPLMKSINNLIKKSKNITSTFRIIINRTLIGILLTIPALLIAGFIRLATTNPHKISDNAIEQYMSKANKTSDAIPNTKTSDTISHQKQLNKPTENIPQSSPKD